MRKGEHLKKRMAAAIAPAKGKSTTRKRQPEQPPAQAPQVEAAEQKPKRSTARKRTS